MKRNTLFKSVTIFILVVMLLLLAACGQQAKNSGSTAKSGDGSAASDSSQQDVNQAEDSPLSKYTPAIEINTVNTMFHTVDKLPEGQTIEDNVWTRAYEQELGIKVNILWSVDSGNAEDKMNLVIASGDLPDLFNATQKQLDQLIEAGKVEDIKQYWDKYASDQLRKEYEKDGGRTLAGGTRNDKLYSIGFSTDPFESVHFMWIRTDWLKNLDLSVPKTWDELTNVIDAFTTKDPDGNGKNDTYGMGLYKDLFTWDIGLVGFMSAFHAYPKDGTQSFYWKDDGNGKLYPGFYDPQFRDALLKLQEMYKNKQISKQFATLDGSQITEEAAQDKFGLCFSSVWEAGWRMKVVREKHPDADWVCATVPAIDGKPAMYPTIGANLKTMPVIRKGYEHPEVLVKMCNLFTKLRYEKPEVYILPTEEHLVWRASPVVPIPLFGDVERYFAVKEAITTGNTDGLTDAVKQGYYRDLKAYRDGDTGDISKWSNAKYYDPDPSVGSFGLVDKLVQDKLVIYNGFFGTPTKTMLLKQETFDTKFNETVVRVIMGADIKEWDAYIDFWKKGGGEQIVQEVNAWAEAVK